LKNLQGEYLMKSRMMALMMVMVLLASVLAGCGGGGQAAGEEAAVTTLTIATPADAKSLDPHLTNDLPSNNVMANIYENLLTLDENGELVGQLAEKWEKVDDLSYKFYLKKGVKFHNGEEFTASDVKFSLLRAMTIEGSAVSHVVGEIDPEGIQVVDDHTVIIKLKRPFSVFLTYLTHIPGGIMLNEKAVTEAGDT
jgi:peptide/nickel transport system substrate-binding protein